MVHTHATSARVYSSLSIYIYPILLHLSALAVVENAFSPILFSLVLIIQSIRGVQKVEVTDQSYNTLKINKNTQIWFSYI